MKTFFVNAAKVLLVIALVLLVLKFWPVLALPALLVAVLTLVLGGVAALIAVLVIGLALAALGGATAVVVAVAGAVFPLALPVLAIVGLIALIRHLSRPRTHA